MRLLCASRENLMSGRIMWRRKCVAPYQGKSAVALALGGDVVWGHRLRHRGASANGALHCRNGEAVCSHIKNSLRSLLVLVWISMVLLMLVPELQGTALWITANPEVRLEDFKSVFPLAEHRECCDHCVPEVVSAVALCEPCRHLCMYATLSFAAKCCWCQLS